MSILPAVIAVGTLLLVGTAALLFLQAQERHLVNEVQRGAALFSETIKSSTYHDMLADRRDSAYLVMDTIGRQAGIDRVRFFNKEGRVTFSSDRSEIGHDGRQAGRAVLQLPRGRPAARAPDDASAQSHLRVARATASWAW